MEYIAHIRNIDQQIQTVPEHCQSVSEYAECWGKKIGISSVMKLASLLHDSGKCTARFNSYIKGESNAKRGDIDHSYAGAKFIREFAAQNSNKYICETVDFIARIIVSHHGLHDWIDADCEDYLQKRTSKNDDYSEISAQLNQIINEENIEKFLNNAAAEYEALYRKIFKLSNKNKTDFCFYMGMVERFAQSILVDADRTDTAEFMSGEASEKRENISDDVWKTICENVENISENFRKKQSKIDKLRMDISDRCFNFAKKPRGICRLIVPTGGGKTVSSFRFAANYCKNFNKSRIFYVAPFMSILEQNSSVLKSLTINEEWFLEHHSNIVAELDSDEELNEYELKCESWSSPVIATTTVQFLNAIFSGKMSSVRRFHQLADSVIIVDEVQAMPLKCVCLFNLAMNFLAKICGSVIVLCTATQPELSGIKTHALLLDEDNSISGDYSKDFEYFKRTELLPEITPMGYDYEQAADFAHEKYLQNSNLLFVANTKKSALTMFKLLKEKNENSQEKAEIIHLSTSMCPCHRKEKLDYARKLLQEKKPLICVTTQLIEAGVDISFNCVIRSLAGLESIAQAAGRCNRHGEAGIKPVYVIRLIEEKLGNSLKQIKSAQDIAVRIFQNPELDFFGDIAISNYFKLLYKEYDKELSYRVKDSDSQTNLVNLLSDNVDRRHICDTKTQKRSPFYGQAFLTAGKFFKVIDEDSRDVLVPYNQEATDIIQKLDSDIYLSEQIKLLRKSQKYTVSLYANAFNNMIENGQIYPLQCGGIYALKKEAFSDDYGIENENQQMKPLIF